MGNREERNEYATAKWDAEEVRRQASSEPAPATVTAAVRPSATGPSSIWPV